MSMQHPMLRLRKLAATGFVAAILAAGPPAVARAADGMGMIEQSPKPSEIIDGSAVSLLLRYDRPIDHGHSRFVLVTPKGERVIRPSLDSEPDALYARVGRLPAGAYELRWHARAADGHMLSGTVPFQVRAS
jgi:methionine-rich copper-binding protein CopC